MALAPSTLAGQLAALFSAPPATEAACTARWAAAIQAYAVSIVPPSTTVATAGAALVGDLVGFNATNQTASVLATAMANFAATVAGQPPDKGMWPAFSAAPPPSPLVIVFSNHPTSTAAGQAIANAIHAWMITGTAVNNATSATVNWS